MTADMLRLHNFEPRSRANGPGIRSVVWLQGCTLKCQGCFNPATHPTQGGYLLSIHDLVNKIIENPDTEGLTISGGEPLHQIKSLATLLEQIHSDTKLSTILFTGYEWEEISSLQNFNIILKAIDVILYGRYHPSQNVAQFPNGSKKIKFLTDRYTFNDLDKVPTAEIHIDVTGVITNSGINPIAW
jgi:anaerobic ribonucleoside-triphosphate reductase activating protein